MSKTKKPLDEYVHIRFPTSIKESFLEACEIENVYQAEIIRRLVSTWTKKVLKEARAEKEAIHGKE